MTHPVSKYLDLFEVSRPDLVAKLQQAAARVWHDASKLQEPELSGFEGLRIRLADVQFGTPEYSAALAEARPVIAHHYAANDHHPEHYEDGVYGMSLLSVLEMLCDWKAAGERTKNGSMRQSLTVNIPRFKIEDQLATLLMNTARELGWLETDGVK